MIGLIPKPHDHEERGTGSPATLLWTLLVLGPSLFTHFTHTYRRANMAFSINKMSALGNIGTDLEVRDAGGTPVLNFSIACNEKFKKRGETDYTEKTEWIRAVAWGKPAEIIAEYASKGSKIYIEGQLQTRKYEKEGQDHYSTEVNVREFVLLDGKSGNSKSGDGKKNVVPVEKDTDDYPF